MLGLRFCARAFSSCGKRGPLFIAVRGPLTIAASLVAEHKLQMRRLSTCGSRAQLLLGMWDLPRPGLEPVSPALAGRLSTTAPPGKPLMWVFCFILFTLLLVKSLWHLWHLKLCLKWFSLRFFCCSSYSWSRPRDQVSARCYWHSCNLFIILLEKHVNTWQGVVAVFKNKTFIICLRAVIMKTGVDLVCTLPWFIFF